MPVEILLVSMARAVVQVAGLFMIGQGVLWLFGPRAREGNFIYDLFKKGTSPIMKLTRLVTPRFVHDAHVGLVAFFLLAWLYVGLTVAKVRLCAAHGVAPEACF